MSAPSFEIRMHTDKAFQMLQRLAKEYKHPKVAYEAFEQAYLDERAEVFATQGSVLGAPWEPHKDSHLEWRKRARKRGAGQGRPKPTGPPRLNRLSSRTFRAVTGKRGGRKFNRTKKHFRIQIKPYPGFHDSLHQTRHPWYIINWFRPIQLEDPLPKTMARISRDLQRKVAQISSRVGAK